MEHSAPISTVAHRLAPSCARSWPFLGSHARILHPISLSPVIYSDRRSSSCVHSLSSRTATPDLLQSSLLASAKRVREDLAAWFRNHSSSEPKVPQTAAAVSVPDHDAHHHALPHVPHGRDVSLLPFSLVANNQELVYASLLSDLSNLVSPQGPQHPESSTQRCWSDQVLGSQCLEPTS